MDVREASEYFVKFLSTDVTVYFHHFLAVEIVFDESLEIHGKVVVDVFQCFLFICNHHVGIFPDDMDLLYTLPIKIVQVSVIFLLVPAAVIHIQTLKFYLVVKHHESTLDTHDSGFRQEQQRFFNHFSVGKCHLEQTVGIIAFDQFCQ